MGFGGLNMMRQYKSLGTTLKNGLISVWGFDELAGTTLYDLYGVNNGTNNNVTLNQTGKIDKSYLFNGSFIDFGNVSSLNPLSDRSFSIWTKLNTVAIDGTLISKWNDSANKIGNYLIFFDNISGFSGNSKVISYIVVNNPIDATNWLIKETVNNSITKIGVWNHIVIVHKWGIGVDIYLNGVLSTGYSRNITFTHIESSTDSSLLGAINPTSSTSKRLSGYLDQTAIWNRALTETEVLQLYNSGNGLPFTNW